MIFGSICSGIEAASTAWHPLGWTTAYVAEIEPFPCAVLAARIGGGRPMFMPDPDEVEIPAGYGPEDIGSLRNKRADKSLDEAEATALQALETRADRLANIRALDSVAWGDRVPNYGDFTRLIALVESGEAPGVGGLVGGTPCQAFSVAGNRQSLADARGNLTLQFVRLIHAHARRTDRPLQWAVWENVPGVLSTDDNAFGCFLAGLVGGDDSLCVPGGGRWPDAGMVAGPLGRAAWRILDAQHFGVAQRRRRVFLVFCPRSSPLDPVAILFERKGMSWDFAPGGEAGEGIAGTITGGARERGGFSYDDVPLAAPTLLAGGNRTGGTRPPGTTVDNADSLIAVEAPALARCVATREGNSQDFESTTMIAHTLRAEGFDGTGRGTPLAPCDPIAFDCKASGQSGFGVGEVPSPLRSMGHANGNQNGGGHSSVATASAVRRLTPRECERLQSFPDDHTDIEWKGKTAPDGPRYKALGNSKAVVVVSWLGQRIEAFAQGTLDGWHFDWAKVPWVKVGGQSVGSATAFALRGREDGAMPEIEGDIAGALRAAAGGSSRSYVGQSA